VCCLLVLDSVTSTPQWIRQPKPRDVLISGPDCGEFTIKPEFKFKFKARERKPFPGQLSRATASAYMVNLER
jgi:hypothetical protein